VILYALGKSSFGCRAKLFGVSRTTTCYWIRAIAVTIANLVIADDIHEIDCDEMSAIPAEPASPVITELATGAFRKRRCENTP